MKTVILLLLSVICLIWCLVRKDASSFGAKQEGAPKLTERNQGPEFQLPGQTGGRDIAASVVPEDQPISEWTRQTIGRMFGRVEKEGFDLGYIGHTEHGISEEQYISIKNAMNSSLNEEIDRIRLVPVSALQGKSVRSDARSETTFTYTVPGDPAGSKIRLSKLYSKIDEIFNGGTPVGFKEKLLRFLELDPSFRMLGKYEVVVSFRVPDDSGEVVTDESAYDERSSVWHYTQHQGGNDIPSRYSKLFKSVNVP